MAARPTMILCDNNILIEFYKGNPATIQALRDIGQANIAVSVITKAELLFGARDKQELAKINKHLTFCHCYPLATDISDLFIGLMADYSLSHRPSIYDASGAICSLQAIFPETCPALGRDKYMLVGGGLAGLFWWLGAKSDTVLIGEGFATCATLHEETRHRVYIAFTANNLLVVGRLLREKLPDAELVFCADNDTKTLGNPGLTKATEAAQAVGGGVAVPPVHGDFNDYAAWLRGQGNG